MIIWLEAGVIRRWPTQGLQPKRAHKFIYTLTLEKFIKPGNTPVQTFPGFSAKAGWFGGLNLPRAEARSK
ncbi:MAG: hypothetical protein M9926_01230 [Lentimicrobium sp.]|uniref:hypothetical protein n=1 Tax=Lentimicrobium sp. TaxID=2034841 RepID=UPI0025D3AB3A|nr:hypothetical protein [Lentimicrobium sp.]MCO5255354.1 hypothetical protein [Lentimicrobium sp.]MCO5263687.1 hypothetical protein [Lentimicrobium sp.]HPF63865.1 hypothetical protein [Lentimicrobium sp.]